MPKSKSKGSRQEEQGGKAGENKQISLSGDLTNAGYFDESAPRLGKSITTDHKCPLCDEVVTVYRKKNNLYQIKCPNHGILEITRGLGARDYW